MNAERIKEIQGQTAYPNSVSVQQALLKVWNECERQQPTEANNHPDTKQLIIGDVSGLLANCTNCGQELQLEVKEMTNKDIIDALQANNR